MTQILLKSDDEAGRMDALRRYNLLDTPAEQSFDDITKLAAFICGVPIAIMTLVDGERQWFKSKIGLSATQTPREDSFCAHAMLQSKLMVVEDARSDERFAANPLVTGNPNIRFYAGAPLITSEGYGLGALCVIDPTPRRLTDGQSEAMEALARIVIAQMEFRRISSQLAEALTNVRTLSGLLPICAWCKGVRNDAGYWQKVETYIGEHSQAELSHCLCPDCAKKYFPDIKS